MKRKIFSLQKKFMIIALGIAIIPLTIVGGISYTKSMNIINNQLGQSNLNTLKQMADSIDEMFSSMEDFATYLWRDKEVMHYLKYDQKDAKKNYDANMLQLQRAVNTYTVFEENLYSVYVYGYNGLIFDTNSAQNKISPDTRKALTELKGSGMLVPDVLINYNDSETNVFAYERVFKNPDNLSEDLGIIKLNVKEKRISDIYGSKLLSPKCNTFIVDDQNKIISASSKKQMGSILANDYMGKDFHKDGSNYYFKKVNGEELLITYANLGNRGWKLIQTIPVKEISKDSEAIKTVTFIAISISMFLSILIGYLLTSTVLSPLKQLRKSMANLERENFNLTLPVKGNDEITLVCKEFNKMSKKLSELINEVYRVQLKQREAELKLLQEQINPHFLYNTLNIIYWNCKLEKASGSAELVDSLSKLFRLSLNSGNDMTTVRKEVEHLNNYILIQKKRFEDMIQFNIKVDEETLDCKVVKLILQPLVENSICHGIEKKGSEGIVDIHIYLDEATLVYEVRDDGAGADREELERLLNSVGENNRGFGIKNVNDRIKLHFGDEYGVEFHTQIDKGMVVVVRQPFDNIL